MSQLLHLDADVVEILREIDRDLSAAVNKLSRQYDAARVDAGEDVPARSATPLELPTSITGPSKPFPLSADGLVDIHYVLGSAIPWVMRLFDDDDMTEEVAARHMRAVRQALTVCDSEDDWASPSTLVYYETVLLDNADGGEAEK